MVSGFTFERALSMPFSAPHFKSFPWLFGAAYAGCYLGLFLVAFLAGGRDFAAWAELADSISEETAGDVGAIMGSFFGRFFGLFLFLGLAAWALWAMFETASQRRYIWGKPFTLGFGADEARMMVVGLLWGLLGVVIFVLPLLLILGGAFASLFADLDQLEGGDMPEQFLTTLFTSMGLMALLFPAYVFFATRLAPCFGLTVKDKRIRFLDAWNVSRGRFWPILGAYVILAVSGSIIIQLLQGVGQILMEPVMMIVGEGLNPDDPVALLTSPAFVIPIGLFTFFSLFLQGLLQHVVGGPAALAARCDPRGGVDELSRIDAFS